MKKIAIASKRSPERAARYQGVFKSVYHYLKQAGKEVYAEKAVAEILCLKNYREFVRGKTDVDLILIMGGDGTTLSVVRQLRKLNTPILGINMGTLGFMSEISPKGIINTLKKIFDGHYTLDKRSTLCVQVWRGKKLNYKFHALNEVAITQGNLARLIRLRTTVNQRKLITYNADGLIVATPTGSTAYSLSAGGPIVYPSLPAFILTPICPHSFTQKPIVIPDSKTIDITMEDENRSVNLTIDGQESIPIAYKDRIHIRRHGVVQFVRLPSESFFSTLREKLNWGKKAET